MAMQNEIVAEMLSNLAELRKKYDLGTLGREEVYRQVISPLTEIRAKDWQRFSEQVLADRPFVLDQ